MARLALDRLGSLEQEGQVIASVREACLTIDRLWREALADGGDEAVHLGEASQALHRALIALTPF